MNCPIPTPPLAGASPGSARAAARVRLQRSPFVVRPLARPDLEEARNATPEPHACTGISGSSAPFWASDLMAARSFE